MNLRLLATKILGTAREEGFAGLSRKAVSVLRNRETHAFDKRFGTDTSGIVHLWNCSIDSKNARTGVRYAATDDAALQAEIEESVIPRINRQCGDGRYVTLPAAAPGTGSLKGL
jgi:hypothetical protein